MRQPRVRAFEGRGGLRLVADELGPETAPFVVLVHGGGQSRRAWRGGARSIAAAGYRVLAIDMRGHGDSAWAADGAYALEDWSDDLERVVLQLAAESRGRVALVGASRGGQSCLVTAARRPERAAAVVLVDVTPQTDDSGIDLIRAFFQRSAEGFASLDEAAAVLSSMLGRPPRGDSAGLARAMRRQADGRYYWLWDPAMGGPRNIRPPTEGPMMAEAARRVGAPTLLLRAGSSELVRPEDIEHFRKLLPALEVEELPGVGHMMSGDDNAIYTGPILRFLERHLPLAAAPAATVRADLSADR